MNPFTTVPIPSESTAKKEKKGADCFNLTSIVDIMDHINRSVQDHTGLGCGCSREKKKKASHLRPSTEADK